MLAGGVQKVGNPKESTDACNVLSTLLQTFISAGGGVDIFSTDGGVDAANDDIKVSLFMSFMSLADNCVPITRPLSIPIPPLPIFRHLLSAFLFFLSPIKNEKLFHKYILDFQIIFFF